MRYRLLFFLLLLAACIPPARAQDPVVAVAPPLFELHSGLWLNLHHFLYVQARARAGHDAERRTVTSSLADTVGLDALPAAQRAAWDSALTYYGRTVARTDLTFDSAAVVLKERLARLERSPRLSDPALDSVLVRHLESAAMAYRARWWPAHDSTNRAWVASMLPLLRQYGDSIARGVSRVAGMSWPAEPIRVDVAAYTNWAGAYATTGPSHVMISSTAPDYRGTLGLEMLYHEAMHTFEDSLDVARRRARLPTGERVPYPLVHSIIFYTAGDVTRRTVPGHTPYIEATGLARRGMVGRYLPALQRHWKARIDGSLSLDSAIARIVREL